MSIRRLPRSKCERWIVDLIVPPVNGVPLANPRPRPLTLNEADAQHVHERIERGDISAIEDAKRSRDTGVPLVAPPPEPVVEVSADSQLEDYATYWFDHKLREIKPTTARGYHQSLKNHVVPQLGHLRLGDVTEEHVRMMLREVQRPGRTGGSGLAPKTVNNLLALVHKMFDHAVRNEHILRNPCEGVHGCPMPPSATVTTLNTEEAKEYCAVAVDRSPEFGPALATLLCAGLRVGELAALRWEDLDLREDAPTMHVRRSYSHGHMTTPKGGTSRQIPIPRALARLLRAHKARFGTAALCFPYTKGRGAGEDDLHLNSNRLKHHHNAVIEALGKPHMRLHDLRHSCLSAIVNSGKVGLRAAQAIAGHQNIKTTERYLHADDAEMRRAMSVFDFGELAAG
jgi:integrase